VEYYAAFPGCADYTEPSAKTIKTLIEKAKANGVRTIYYAEGADTTAAESIADEVGGETALLHSCHRVTRKEFDSGRGYLDFMRENLETLKNSD
jgi:zinc transport system substrate-binding protein